MRVAIPKWDYVQLYVCVRSSSFKLNKKQKQYEKNQIQKETLYNYELEHRRISQEIVIVLQDFFTGRVIYWLQYYFVFFFKLLTLNSLN